MYLLLLTYIYCDAWVGTGITDFMLWLVGFVCGLEQCHHQCACVFLCFIIVTLKSQAAN